jgi:hypothetical protein
MPSSYVGPLQTEVQTYSLTYLIKEFIEVAFIVSRWEWILIGAHGRVVEFPLLDLCIGERV